MTLSLTADEEAISHVDDEALVDGWVREHDETCFREIYRRHTPVLYRLAVGLVGDEDAAQDVVQDVWIRASRRMGGFGRRSALRTWLCGVTVNCCREWRKRASRRSTPLNNPSHHVDGDPSITIDVLRALESLPARAREVLVLHGAGHTHVEIGAILGVKDGTSKSQLSYARKLLRARIDGEQKGDDDE